MKKRHARFRGLDEEAKLEERLDSEIFSALSFEAHTLLTRHRSCSAVELLLSGVKRFVLRMDEALREHDQNCKGEKKNG